VTSKQATVNHNATRKNFLATQAKGKYIIFVDPEMFHINNTIQCFLSHIHEREKHPWICGPVYASEDVVNAKGELIDNAKPLKNFFTILHIANNKNFFKTKLFYTHYHLIDYKLYSTPFYCVMFKRDDFLNLKGLNQNLKVRGYEEMELYERFAKNGGHIIIDTAIKTIHLPHPKSLDTDSQISWNLYNSTVTFDPHQKIGEITDATFKQISL
jgi:hypothetical protein